MLKNDIKVIKSEPSHFTRIAYLESRCFSSPWKEDEIKHALENPAIGCFSAIAENKEDNSDILYGYGMMFCAADECEIINIATDEEYRNFGIGMMIMEHMLEDARGRGCLTVYLEVRESNAPARHLYEKLGFFTAGIRKNYYRKPTENAVIMILKLG